MRTWWIACLVFCGGALPGTETAVAQRFDLAGRFALQPRVGIGLPMNDFADATGADFEVGGKFQYHIWNRVALLFSWVHYPNMEFKEQLGSGKFRFTPMTVEGNLYLTGQGRTRPFVSGGVGYYRITRDASNSDLRREHQIGSNIGGGVEYFLGQRACLVGDLRLHIPASNAQVLAAGIGLNIYMGQ